MVQELEEKPASQNLNKEQENLILQWKKTINRWYYWDDRAGHYIMINEAFHQENIATLNMYVHIILEIQIYEAEANGTERKK